MQENLFKNLHALNRGWDEDFVTESFVYLLRYLIEYSSSVGKALLTQLSGSRLSIDNAEIGDVKIRTQEDSIHGVPDIWIETSSQLLCIEVKVDSDFAHDQLIRYRKILDESSYDSTTLTTLTRYPLAAGAGGCLPDVSIRWHEIANTLKTHGTDHSVGNYLIREFVGFLQHRGLVMESVSWELIPGLKSLQNLLNMMAEAAASARIEYDYKGATLDHYGFVKKPCGPSANEIIRFGIVLSEPNCIFVQTEKATIPTDQAVDMGVIQNGQWRSKLDLESEEIHFFTRSKSEQLACLEEFLSTNVPYAVTLIESTINLD